MEKIGVIIQARARSTRLPKKVLEVVEGKTILEHVIERVKRAEKEIKIVLATTKRKEDDVLEALALKCGILVFRGSEDDVLDRFYQAAKKYGLNHIVRITADCPVIDPEIIKNTIDCYLEGGFDYVGNAHPPTFPDGMDVETFNFKALEKSWKEAKPEEDREHVTSYIWKNPKIFKTENLQSQQNLCDLRLTLDEKEDLLLIAEIYKELYKKNPEFGLVEILNLFLKKPELAKINQKIISHPISRWKGVRKYYEE